MSSSSLPPLNALRAFEAMFEAWLRAYEWALDWVLAKKALMLVETLATLGGEPRTYDATGATTDRSDVARLFDTVL